MNIRKPVLFIVFLVIVTAFLASGCQKKPNKNSAWEDALLNSTEPTEPQETEQPQKTEAEALYDYFAMTFYGGADRLYAAAPEDYWQSLTEFTFDDAKDHVDNYAAETIEFLKSQVGKSFNLRFRTGEVVDVEEEIRSQIIADVASKPGLYPEKATKVVQVSFAVSYGSATSNNNMYMLCYDGAWYPVAEPENNSTDQYILAVEADMNSIRKMIEKAQEE